MDFKINTQKASIEAMVMNFIEKYAWYIYQNQTTDAHEASHEVGEKTYDCRLLTFRFAEELYAINIPFQIINIPSEGSLHTALLIPTNEGDHIIDFVFNYTHPQHQLYPIFISSSDLKRDRVDLYIITDNLGEAINAFNMGFTLKQIYLEIIGNKADPITFKQLLVSAGEISHCLNEAALRIPYISRMVTRIKSYES